MQAVIGIAFFVMLGLVRSSTEAFDHEAEQTQGKVPNFLRELTNEKYIQLAMMCDAADEEIRMIPCSTIRMLVELLVDMT